MTETANTQVQMTEEDIRKAVLRAGDLIPGVADEAAADAIVGLMTGELTLKDVQGLSDDQMESIYALAYNAFRAGRHDEAHKLFVFLSLFDPFDPRFWLGLGACRFSMGDFDNAVDAYSMAGFIDELDPVAHLRCADCQLALGHTEDAISSLEIAVERATDKPDHQKTLERAEALIGLLREMGTNTAEGSQD